MLLKKYNGYNITVYYRNGSISVEPLLKFNFVSNSLRKKDTIKG